MSSPGSSKRGGSLGRRALRRRAVEFLYLSAGAAFLCGLLGAVSAGGLGGLVGMGIGAAGPWAEVCWFSWTSRLNPLRRWIFAER